MLPFVSAALLWTLSANNAPLPPEQSAEAMHAPEGFRVRLVASEPQLVKPIAMTTDDRGRLWVIESHSYPHWVRDGSAGKDRILILEDKDGKGRYDCKVFWDRGTNLSGIALGFGGVWLCSAPNLLFLPLKDGEDKPAGPAKVVLDGWSLNAKHNVFNGLTWGPDGWLYGLNGITDTSRIGKPGTPPEQRARLNCGVWRYHPTLDRFEPFAWGTTNPWGIDFDDLGEMFITNCVIKHIFHVVPGAHFVRMFGEDLNPHCYGLIESCADHIHWAGGHWTSARGGEAHSENGGGHAHAGCMVYLGDNWPAEYRNRVFMGNIHGNRLNQDILDRTGSGYVARHGKDFLHTRDSWFRPLGIQPAADGSVFVSDWCDTGECHNYDKTHPFGRIYQVSFGVPRRTTIDFSRLPDDELVRLQTSKNEWHVRHARRLLQERADAGKLAASVRPQLNRLLANEKDVPRKLRLLWALHAVGGLDAKTLRSKLDSAEPPLRTWAVRLLVEEGKVSPSVADRLGEMARTEKTASVRLALASALQRLPAEQRWPIAEGLTARAVDAADPYLPLMIWYGVEPLPPAAPQRALALLNRVRIPLVRQNIARRIASSDQPGAGLAPLVKALSGSTDSAVQLDILRGAQDALRGLRRLQLPDGWLVVRRKLAESADAEVRQKVLLLSVRFGDQEAVASLRKTAGDVTAEPGIRQTALQTLIEAQPADLSPLLRELLADRQVRVLALRGLASFNDPAAPAAVLRHYAEFTDAEKADAVNTLASRPEFAFALLAAVEKGQIPRRDISALTARQLLNFKNKQLTEKLTAVWGTIRPTARDKAVLLAKYKGLVPPGALARADRSRGRAIFAKTCAACHTLFNEGGKVGPDLTGSQRTNPEYILSKVLDPNAVVAKDYQVSIVVTKAGRSITGIVRAEDAKTLTIQTQTEAIVLAKSDIEERQKTAQSIMPEGQLAPLSDAEIRDLIAYLAGPNQVPLPKK